MSEHTKEKPTYLISGPFPVNDPGYDGEIHRWFIGTHPFPIDVKFTGTAIAVGTEGVSGRAERALLSEGKSELLEFLNWKRPPDSVEFSTDNWPYIEGGEME